MSFIAVTACHECALAMPPAMLGRRVRDVVVIRSRWECVIAEADADVAAARRAGSDVNAGTEPPRKVTRSAATW
jgi:hypothetical protein